MCSVMVLNRHWIHSNLERGNLPKLSSSNYKASEMKVEQISIITQTTILHLL
jgi:hypothetical protein